MSDILDSMHDLAQSLHRVGAMDDLTMKVMTDLCLPAARQFSTADVQAIRRKTRMSQPIFAAVLGVSASAVAQWERGAKKPGGPAARLLDLIDRKGLEAVM